MAEDDVVWWLGATRTVVRAALAALDAEAARLTTWLDGVRLGTSLRFPP